MKKDKLAVFDLDGTLFDTAEVNYQAYKKAAEEIGYSIDKENFMKYFVGRNYKEFLPLFGIKSDLEIKSIHEKKKEIYSRYLKFAHINQSLFSLIDSLKTDYIVALATTASKRNTMDILNAFGKKEVFDYIITQEDIDKLKPDPECYVVAMQKSGVTAEKTIIFEDSDVGIEAGLASGAKVYKVCNCY